MRNQKSMSERFIEAMQNTGDIMLRYQYQKDMIKNQLLSDVDIDRLADKVLSRIALKTNIEQAIANIEELQRAINNLGK